MSEQKFLPDFEKRGGLVPAIVQDARTLQVLMLGWVNEEAWKRTFETGRACFWSTSRQELWEKGATSGDWLRISEVLIDCDDDTVLYSVLPEGNGACHTTNSQGQTRKSCFYRKVDALGQFINLEP